MFDETDALEERLLHGPGIDQALATEDCSGNVLWLLADNQGTIRDVASYNAGTDTTTVVNHLQYDAFGNITVQSNSTYEPRFTYTGREWDADAELFYYRARWYDPQVGKFISEDPIGFLAGDPNITRYVSNSTPNFTDPSGLYATSAGEMYTVTTESYTADSTPLELLNNEGANPDGELTQLAMARENPEWHHLLPQNWDFLFEELGIDHHDPKYGWLLDPGDHDNITDDWKFHWDAWLEEHEDDLRKNKKLALGKIEAHLDDLFTDKRFIKVYKRGTKTVVGYREWSNPRITPPHTKLEHFRSLKRGMTILGSVLVVASVVDTAHGACRPILGMGDSEAQLQYRNVLRALANEDYRTAQVILFGNTEPSLANPVDIAPQGLITRLMAELGDGNELSRNSMNVLYLRALHHYISETRNAQIPLIIPRTPNPRPMSRIEEVF